MPFNSIESILDFLSPVDKSVLSGDGGYNKNQLGFSVAAYETTFPSPEVDLVIVGCNEMRGAGMGGEQVSSADAVRRELYNLYYWHRDVTVADAGNIRPGASLQDTYAALRTVVDELLHFCRKVVIIGGSHDLTVAQYKVYASRQKIIEATCVDAMIDLDVESGLPCHSFLMNMLTGEPNYIRHYNHIGFQSYFVHPGMLETIDKLRFDCFRVGMAKENIEEMEPVIRNASLFSFDISAIQHAHAPANRITPNGFTGEEACILMQYAGMSSAVDTVGIYGYVNGLDTDQMTAKQVSHMVWYLLDGMLKGKQEASLDDQRSFNEFTIAFAEVETTFLQSKKTGRWWMRLPDGQYIACSQKDYTAASQNEMPERWLRALERS